MLLTLVICIAIITAIIVSAFIKANRRMQYADMRSAMRTISDGNSRPPSWTKDNDRVHEFLYVVSKLAIRKGVPEEFATKAVATLTNASVALAHCAGAMEVEGASFNAQKLAAADMLFDIWNNSGSEHRNYLLEEHNAATRFGNLHESPNEQRSILQEIDELADQLLTDKRSINDGKKFVDSYFSFMDSCGDINAEKTMKKPTWITSVESLKNFTSYVVEESSRHGVAETYAMAMLLNKHSLNVILGCVSSAENQGFDFGQQKSVGVEFVKRGWNNLDESTKNIARNIALDADGIEMLSSMD